MQTPFDPILDNIKDKGFHNHRDASHSNLLTEQISNDLKHSCDALEADFNNGVIQEWHTVRGPDGRNTDLIIGASKSDGTPDLTQVRILIEHKSVVTAHRNKNARYQDIEREMLATHAKNPLTIVGATLVVGVCKNVLNVPDCVKREAKRRNLDFDAQVRPRLSSGDATLWQDFADCVSKNKEDDALKTVEMFKALPVRPIAQSHEKALDFMLFIPVVIDNVNPPRLGGIDNIDPVADYRAMIGHICRAYKIRWP